jgi:excisionase family DNA binding protein
VTAPLLSPEDVAALCGLSRKAVYRAIERGELQASRLCSRLRIRPENVEDWLAANQVGFTERVTESARAPLPDRLPAPGGLRTLMPSS